MATGMGFWEVPVVFAMIAMAECVKYDEELRTVLMITEELLLES